MGQLSSVSPRQARLRRSVRTLILGTAIICCVTLGCQSAPYVPPTSAAASPVHLGHGSQKIVFSKVMFRISAGERVGTVFDLRRNRELKEKRWDAALMSFEGYNVAVTDRMLEHGYSMVDPAKVLFSADSTVKTRLQLAGVVKRMRMDDYVNFFRQEGGSKERDSAAREVILCALRLDGLADATQGDRVGGAA